MLRHVCSDLDLNHAGQILAVMLSNESMLTLHAPYHAFTRVPCKQSDMSHSFSHLAKLLQQRVAVTAIAMPTNQVTHAVKQPVS